MFKKRTVEVLYKYEAEHFGIMSKGDKIMKRYLPENYNENRSLFDAFDSLFKPMFFDETREMRTDIRETDDSYLLDIEMPGFSKDDLKVSLEDGYLTVSGERKSTEESNKKTDKYLRKERSESFQRSYYVGTDISEENIRAKYENGILCLNVPKSKPKAVHAHTINID